MKSVAAVLKDPRAYRKQLGMTQADFWELFGVTQSGGSRYETGRSMDVPLRTLLALHVSGHAELVAKAIKSTFNLG